MCDVRCRSAGSLQGTPHCPHNTLPCTIIGARSLLACSLLARYLLVTYSLLEHTASAAAVQRPQAPPLSPVGRNRLWRRWGVCFSPLRNSALRSCGRCGSFLAVPRGPPSPRFPVGGVPRPAFRPPPRSAGVGCSLRSRFFIGWRLWREMRLVAQALPRDGCPLRRGGVRGLPAIRSVLKRMSRQAVGLFLFRYAQRRQPAPPPCRAVAGTRSATGRPRGFLPR